MKTKSKIHPMSGNLSVLKVLSNLKQKPKELDWKKKWEKLMCECFSSSAHKLKYFTWPYKNKAMKDFIEATLTQQRTEPDKTVEDFKQKMADSNEWWNKKLSQQRTELLEEIINKYGDMQLGDRYQLKDFITNLLNKKDE